MNNAKEEKNVKKPETLEEANKRLQADADNYKLGIDTLTEFTAQQKKQYEAQLAQVNAENAQLRAACLKLDGDRDKLLRSMDSLVDLAEDRKERIAILKSVMERTKK